MHTIDAAECKPADWDQFARDHGWFWHTSLWRDYTQEYAAARNPRSVGFAVVDGSELVAISPAIIEQAGNSGARISFGGGPTWAPAVHGGLEAHARAAALDMCLRTLEQIADDAGGVALRLQLSPLASAFPERAVEFAGATTRRGYHDRSLTTAVLDLARSEEDLLRDMSKGHRSAIRRAGRIATRVATDSASFATYRELHRQAAGRVTRSSTTFELMRGWLDMGYAAVVLAEIEGEPVGAFLLLICRDGAYYASGATAPEYRRDVVGQALTWEAITWLKQHGVQRYELGIQHRGTLAYDDSTPKEHNISLFKRGFGGLEMPLMIREHLPRSSGEGLI